MRFETDEEAEEFEARKCLVRVEDLERVQQSKLGPLGAEPAR